MTRVLSALFLTALIGAPTAAFAQLQIGGSQANFGSGNLTGGFMPDPSQVQVVSGGSIAASSATGLPPNCRGYVTARPDYILHYTSPAAFLRFFVEAPGDTTLVINDGAGHWHCDDDTGGNANPMIDLPRPASGQYDIWVGSYSAGQQIRGTLNITELTSRRPGAQVQPPPPPPSAGSLIIGGTRANFGTGRLRGGFLPDPHNVAVVSGGSIDSRTAGLPAHCRGFVTRQPDYVLTYTNAAAFLRFYVRAAGDTTLIINDGQGNWHCDDDSGGNTNPMIDLTRPVSGHYDIWVGSYRAGEQIRGTLSVTELTANRP